MKFETIVWRLDGGVATVTLNRPDVLNALNHTMATELLAAWERAASDSAVRCLVLTGAGRAFSAGQDLASVDRIRSVKFSENLRRTWNPTVSGLWSLPKPVVAAVNGPVVGAAMGLALACDLIVASERARFIPAFATLGFVPDAGLTWLLPHRVGMARAMQIALFSEPIDAARALEWGLVNVVVAAEALMDIAGEWAERLATGPTTAFGATKSLMQGASQRSLVAALEREAETQDLVGDTDDSREGAAAFRERRPPRFTGH